MTGIRTFEDLRQRCKLITSTSKRYPSECWVWTGATSPTGCPSIWIPSLRRVGPTAPPAELGVSLSYAGAIKAGKRRPAVSPFAALMTGAA